MHQKLTDRAIYILMYPNCIEFEVMLAAELCNRTHEVRVVTPNGEALRGSTGIKIDADDSLAMANLGRCSGILIPGGDPYELIEGKYASLARTFLIDASEMGVTIGAICAAPAILGKIGLLKSKRFTHGCGGANQELLTPIWEGAIFTDNDVEIDGKLITAKPSAHIDFAIKFAQQVGSISEEQSQELALFYRNPQSNHLSEIISKVSAVSDQYAAKFDIDRDHDWYLLKLQEELGELVQQHLRISNRGRTHSSAEESLQKRNAEVADVFAHILLYAEKHGIDVYSEVKKKWFRWLPK